MNPILLEEVEKQESVGKKLTEIQSFQVGQCFPKRTYQYASYEVDGCEHEAMVNGICLRFSNRRLVQDRYWPWLDLTTQLHLEQERVSYLQKQGHKVIAYELDLKSCFQPEELSRLCWHRATMTFDNGSKVQMSVSAEQANLNPQLWEFVTPEGREHLATSYKQSLQAERQRRAAANKQRPDECIIS